jgi:hypothetical protein
VFDLKAGKEIRKFGKDNASKWPSRTKDDATWPRSAARDPASDDQHDGLSVAFSADGATLYTSVRNGRVVVRDTAEWKIRETYAGFDFGPEDLRITPDAEYATFNSKNGAKLWSKETGKSTSLDAAKARWAANRWSGRPEAKHFFLAPPNAVEKGYPIELRSFDAPDAPAKSVHEALPVQWIEALTSSHAAVVVQRNAGRADDETAGGLWGLRVWDVKNSKSAGEAFLPSMIYGVRASDDGLVLATVVERERAVALWAFDPKGKPDSRFSTPTNWEAEPLLRWSGLNREPLKIEDPRQEPAIRSGNLLELGGGRWQFKAGTQESSLTELRRTNWSIVLSNGSEEIHVFNNGRLWLHKREGFGPRRTLDVEPNFEGLRRISPYSQQYHWRHAFDGHWHPSDPSARLK